MLELLIKIKTRHPLNYWYTTLVRLPNYFANYAVQQFQFKFHTYHADVCGRNLTLSSPPTAGSAETLVLHDQR
jgi:hypothetical protein